MKYKINITELAEEDIRGIFEYIAYELKSKQSAINQISNIEKSILSLSEMPNRHKIYEKN